METRFVDVKIKNPDGSIVFQKDHFEIPKNWSDRAATIMASKYAMDNEYSALGIIDRIVEQIGKWGLEQNYFVDNSSFKEELKDILVNQRAAFNSPVWFNVGSDTSSNQCSACFILPVEDTMESILEHYKIEGKIFNGGSGSGINVSKLRAKGEKLSNKGESSGPISFMKGWDANAGMIKSGGKVRRAAKMVCMDVDHPDIMEFIHCKKLEEDKAKFIINGKMREALAENNMNEKEFRLTKEFFAIAEEAYATVAFQNTNHSIRVTDSFMKAVRSNNSFDLIPRKDKTKTSTVPAQKILSQTANIAHLTGDPGIQYDNAMNQYNPIPNIDRINATNPCSEFCAIDNSSCNLASLNLMAYLFSGEFDFYSFKKDIKTIITAMDILIDAADYPTTKIKEITTKSRPLGLGFSNLGALLMSLGMPYNSGEARELAKEITKEMTTAAYLVSSSLASELGSFDYFKGNQQESTYVAVALTEATEVNTSISTYGLRNSQVTLLAPNGTIGFLMDCDTTGIEPLFALKTYKQLSGGGVLELTYDCVKNGINTLRKRYKYEDLSDKEIQKKHPDVFETANEIDWKGHVDMMAVCQQHLNGAISKTVNLPANATPSDIENIYMYGWEKGLKCIAVYRDGCKELQPMRAITSEKEPEQEVSQEWSAFRKKLSETRQSITHKFDISGFEGYLTVGLYDDGTPGEIFIRAQKQGSTMEGILDSFATAVSLGLQYGVPIETMIDKFTGSKFEPAGFTHNEEIRYASSPMDYIFKWIGLNFIDEEDDPVEEIPKQKEFIASPKKTNLDGPPCPSCGSLTSRNGTCFVCTQCGETTGCS